MNQQELKNILALHSKWIKSEPGGKRANLLDRDLSGADLSGADLTDAVLSGANLSMANLSGAILTCALLIDTNLTGANLEEANLNEIKEDYFSVLTMAKKQEVFIIYDMLLEGKMDGLVNIKGREYKKMRINLTPNADWPAKRWFLALKKGCNPSNNQISKITAKWTEEFMRQNNYWSIWELSQLQKACVARKTVSGLLRPSAAGRKRG